MTLADLAGLSRAEGAQPVCGAYRSPASVLDGAAQLRRRRDRADAGHAAAFPVDANLQPDTLSEVHLFTQASRLAFADRAKYLGDPDFIDVPVEGLLDKGYIASAPR